MSASEGCLYCRGKEPPPGASCRHCGRKGPALPEHVCHAHGCTRACKPENLMCLTHWRLVPRGIQVKVWAAYRPGQCDDKDPSEEWHAAADEAIAAVARVDGFPRVAEVYERKAMEWNDRARRRA